MHGIQAKFWESRRWAVDVPIFYIKWISAAGRSLLIMAQDSGQVGVEAPKHSLFVLVCEDERAVEEIAMRLTLVCKTIAASLRGQVAGDFFFF